MIIGIDGNEGNVEKKVGVSVYTFELLHYFQKHANKDLKFVVYLRHKPRPDLPKANDHFSYRVIKGPFLWRDIFFTAYLYMHREVDVLFSPAHYTPRACPVPIVVTIHDVAYLYFPNEFLKKDLYKLKNWTMHALRQARKIIAVSKSTQKDIVKEYGIPSDRLNVVYNGFRSYSTKELDKGKSFNLPDDPFILYAGTIQPRKNLTRLIEAFHMLRDSYPKHKLVIVGKKGWLFGEVFEKVLDMNLEDHVLFTGYISNAQLAAMYNKAACFVWPSLYEGFGIPLLEAMSYGCPVVASNTGSLPEIGGDACLYFDPRDTIGIADSVSKVLSDKELRASLVKKGKARVKEFSWDECADQTLQIITSVIDTSKK